MRRPSGDHIGFVPRFSTRRTGSPPSTGILNRPRVLPFRPPIAIHFPSGDHAAAPRTSRSSASGLTPVPSTPITYNGVALLAGGETDLASVRRHGSVSPDR